MPRQLHLYVHYEPFFNLDPYFRTRLTEMAIWCRISNSRRHNL